MIVYIGVTGVTLKRSEYNTQPMSRLSDRLVVKSKKRRGIKVTPRLLGERWYSVLRWVRME